MGTTWAAIPICFRSSCTSVAICPRCVLLELTRMVNSTAWPLESTSAPSDFQENPAAFKSSRAFGSERAGTGMVELNHCLLKSDGALVDSSGQDRKSTRLNSSHTVISYA